MSEVDLSLVGSYASAYDVEIERGMIRRFALAIGDSHPTRHDLAAAQAAGHADLVASLTFPVSLRAPVDPPWIAHLDRRRILAGEIGFDYAQRLLAGMRLRCQAQLVDVEEKHGRGGRLQLLRQQTTGRLLDDGHHPGELVFTLSRTTIYRSPTPRQTTPRQEGS